MNARISPLDSRVLSYCKYIAVFVYGDDFVFSAYFVIYFDYVDGEYVSTFGYVGCNIVFDGDEAFCLRNVFGYGLGGFNTKR